MQVVVEFALVDELGVVGVDWFDFNCHLQAGFGVDGLIDLPERTFVDLPNDLEVLSHALQHLRHRSSSTYFK